MFWVFVLEFVKQFDSFCDDINVKYQNGEMKALFTRSNLFCRSRVQTLFKYCFYRAAFCKYNAVLLIILLFVP